MDTFIISSFVVAVIALGILVYCMIVDRDE